MWNKIKNINGLYVLAAIFGAIAFWLYVDVTVEPEAKVTLWNVPVTFYGEEELAEDGLMLTEGRDATVTLTVVGTRAVVSQLSRNNVTISVDLSTQVTEAGEQSLDYSVGFPNTVSTGSVKIHSRSVNAIDVNVVQMRNKTIGVSGAFTGSVKEGYLYDVRDFSFDAEEITIAGEKTLVDQVDHAVATLTEENLSDTWRGTLELVLVDQDGRELSQDGLTLSQTTVEAELPITRVKEISLAVTIEEGGGAGEEDVSWTISPETIRVSGDNEALSRLSVFNVGTIDLSQVVTSDRESFPIELPEGVKIVSGTTVAVVDLSIDSDLTTTKLTTSDIRMVNVPEGVDASLVTEDMEVRLRGQKETMRLLVKNDVYVEVDLSDLSPEASGSVSLPAEVKVRGMSDVGAIGEYEAVVELD